MAIVSTRYFGLTGDPLIDGVTNGYMWSLDNTRTIDFSISNGFNGEYWYNPSAVASYMQTALSYYSLYANVNFNYLGYFTTPTVAAVNGSEINLSLDGSNRFFSSSNVWAIGLFPNSAYNTSYPYYTGAPGDLYININSQANFLPSYEPGTQGWFLLLHELGHALGLKHPHDSGGTGRPTFQSLGIGDWDIDFATVMSYNDDSSWNLYSWDPATPMVLDVLSLMYLYGKNTSTNSGDSSFILKEYNAYLTLWDPSGQDTLDASQASSGWTILLPSVTLSNLIDEKIGVAAPTVDYNSSAPHTLEWLIGDIENVTGTDYSDNITGNNLNNVIDGGSGNDVIDGGAGCDQIDGGAGADLMTGGAQGDIYIVDNLGDQVIETANNDASLTRNVSIFDQTISARLEKFYIAYYGRPADYDGLAYWQTTLANVLHGQEIQMCGYFGNPLQTEFLNLFGSGNTNDSFLTNVYLNLFNRAPDTEGMNYWKGVIADQQAHGKSLDDSRATVVIWVLDGAQADDAQVINNKVNNAIGLSKVIAAYDDTNAYGDPSSSDIFVVARDWLKTTGAHDYSGLSADALQFVAQDILGNTIGDWVGSSVNFTLGNYVENLILTGVNPISGTGNALNNLMIGNAVSNVLTGGAGSDIFMFQHALGINNIDTITDFTHGTDAIFLDQSIFTTLTQGALTANAFYVGSAAHDADDRIIYNASTGALYYDVDGIGGAAAVQIALIGAVSHPTLSNADIFVV